MSDTQPLILPRLIAYFSGTLRLDEIAVALEEAGSRGRTLAELLMLWHDDDHRTVYSTASLDDPTVLHNVTQWLVWASCADEEGAASPLLRDEYAGTLGRLRALWSPEWAPFRSDEQYRRRLAQGRRSLIKALEGTPLQARVGKALSLDGGNES
mgnify:CR=1 FL=1